MQSQLSDLPVRHLPEKRRFQVSQEGQVAFTEYILAKDRIVFTHTEVPPAFEGIGLASRIAHTALEYARSEGLKVMPLCPFVAGYIKRHPEYKELLQPGFSVD